MGNDDGKPFDIQEGLARLPGRPGVYRMYAADGELLYIGKAKNLKSRVRSYFQSNAQHSPKNRQLVRLIARFDYIVTDNEMEALILEDNLVKKHHPRFNVLLRDDKRFPWLCITGEPFPRLIFTRTADRRGKARYFGPYSNAGAMYQTLRMLRKHFPMRQRRKPLFRDRPCMNYFIGTCPGPCQEKISAGDYDKTVRQVELFLKGRTNELLANIEQQMREASEAMNFEWAAKLRDRYVAVQEIMAHQQKVHSDDDRLSRDVIGAAADELRCSIIVLKIREGKLIASLTHELPLVYGSTVEEAYSSFLSQYYPALDPEEIPDELILQYEPKHEDEDDARLLGDLLTHRRKAGGISKRRVSLICPRQGEKQEMLAMAAKNAREALAQSRLADATRLKHDPARALIELQEALDLPDYPARMECYDISHVQGAYTVASMVVFTDGQPDRAEYRRFKIKSAEGKPDDFQSMLEVIRRRFRRSRKDGGEDGWEEPDLVIIDGGKGQLGMAVKALDELGIENQPIVSLAKRFEEVYKPGQQRPVILPRQSSALYLLQQIRDEAHRFAITYHRNLREKGARESVLDNIPGIGKKRRMNLLNRFGSVEQLRTASVEELVRIGGLPARTAETVYHTLRHDIPSPNTLQGDMEQDLTR